MDLQKYEEALDNISDEIVPKYFNNDKQKYIEAKTMMMTIFKKDPREEIFGSHPFFRPYFRKHFLYYCQNAPDFVGIVLSSVSTETVSQVIDFIKDYPKLYYFTISRNKIAVAENSYQEIRKKIINILDSPKIPKNDINEVLNLTKPLSKVIYYWKGRFLYTYLFTELRFSLNLLSSIKEINKMSFPEKIVMIHYNNLLFELGNLKKREYSKYTFIQILIEDLEKIYKRIEEFHSKSKKPNVVSDVIIFTPNESQLKIFSDFQKQHGFIARSEKMLEVFNFIKRNKNDITILITGESGVGKEVLAKAIHNESTRKEYPFVAENCAGKNPQILESTLFGHEKGSFTDASSIHKGIFEQADKGTIFLDEIADMSFDMQSRLLRVLQERKIKRVGGKEEIFVDLRIICATNQDLKKAVELKIFREDLFHRINVASVEIPPLNARRDDIPYLAKHFFDKFQVKYVLNQYLRAPTWITHKNFMPLKEMDWQGNVRELENYMEVFVNNNKEYLSKLEPGMLKILFSDRSKTINDLLKNPTEGDKIFRESRYFDILMLFIENHYDRVKTTEISGYHKDTVRSRLNSCMLQLGMEFEFQQDGMIDYLIDRKILIDDDRDIFTLNITVIFKSIIRSTLKGTQKTFFDPPDKQLVDNLFKLRNDLVTQVKKNTL